MVTSSSLSAIGCSPFVKEFPDSTILKLSPLHRLGFFHVISMELRYSYRAIELITYFPEVPEITQYRIHKLNA
jgi:hypothetical protein